MKRFLFFFLFISLYLTPTFSLTPPPATVICINQVEEVVSITKTGTKFYKNPCHYLKKSKIKMTKTETMSSDYSACIACRPKYKVKTL